MQEIRCLTCGKLLLEASGEVKKICPKCKTVVHVVATTSGIINLDPKITIVSSAGYSDYRELYKEKT